MKVYTVTKTITLSRSLEAASPADALAIAEEMGDIDADTRTTEWRARRNHEERPAVHNPAGSFFSVRDAEVTLG